MRMLVLAVLAVVLSGCFGNSGACNKKQEYQSSTSVKPLKVPDDLVKPDESGRLVIPPGEAPARRKRSDPCLDEPPDYFGRPAA
jgi:uncharacterized lipoprotein